MNRERLNNISIAIAIALIFAYIAFEVYSVSHIEVKTETALISTVYEKIDAKALVIRDEQPVNKASGGITVPCFNDGDKINVGGNVAMRFSNQEAATNYSKYAEIQQSLAYYENLESQTLGQVASVESIDSELESDINTYIRNIALRNTEGLSEAGEKVNDGLVRRQMIIGEKVDLLSIIQDLRQQAQQYASNAKPDSFITTDVSGVFSSYTDGYENVVPYDKVKELTLEQVQTTLDKIEKEKKTTDYLGKLVTSYEWYMACIIDANDAKTLKNGGRVQLSLKDSNDTVLTADVVSGADIPHGEKQSLLILRCNDMNSSLASLRSEDIELRIKSYEGIKVPLSAIHVNEKGEKGVYALVASQVYFRKAEVLYTTDEFAILEFDQGKADGIRLYDKIITQGKELKEGKVYD